MKIVNIMIARGLGGIEQAFLDYNNALLAQGFDVLAITDKRAQINEKITPHQNLKQCKIRFSHLNLFLIWTFYRCFKKYQPDLIIVHSKKALELVIAAAKMLSIKVVGVAPIQSLSIWKNALPYFPSPNIKSGFSPAMVFRLTRFL